MSFSFTCPECQKTLKVSEKYVGKVAKCPGCSASVTIARPVESPSDDDVEVAELASVPSRRKIVAKEPIVDEPKRRGGIPIVGIIAVSIALIVGYFVGREHVKYELRMAFEGAAKGLRNAFSGGVAETEKTGTTATPNSPAEPKSRDEEYKEYLASLKDNPQPLLDRALNIIRVAYVRQVGDDAIASAHIEIDASSLKTFGPEKWKVRGTFDGKDEQGKVLKKMWEVTMKASQRYKGFEGDTEYDTDFRKPQGPVEELN